MLLDERVDTSLETPDESCDIRIWSGECEHEKYTGISQKYLCVSCGMIIGLDHEVGHEIFPHIKGETESLY